MRYLKRNIPACAGKTDKRFGTLILKPEHPRVRGENIISMVIVHQAKGTSPRARGKPFFVFSLADDSRNIPACAGKTSIKSAAIRQLKEHPRVRGENSVGCVADTIDKGTSPRARGKHVFAFIP